MGMCVSDTPCERSSSKSKLTLLSESKFVTCFVHISRSKFTKIDEETQEPVIVEIEPTQTTRDYIKGHCRHYDYVYTKNGITNHGKGFACLNEQGFWQELHHENG